MHTTLSGIAACNYSNWKCFAAQVAISCNVFPTEYRLERLDFYHMRKRVFLWLPGTNVLVDEYPSMTAKISLTYQALLWLEVVTTTNRTYCLLAMHGLSFRSIVLYSQALFRCISLLAFCYDVIPACLLSTPMLKISYLSDLRSLYPSRINGIFAGSRKGHFVAICIASDG